MLRGGQWFVVAMALTASLVCVRGASAWSVTTHIYTANDILEDLEDGSLTFYEVTTDANGLRVASETPLCEVPVAPEVVEAILSQPERFRAGSCGPDGYPDMYFGQSIIHAYEPGQPWRAIDWGHHLMDEARDYENREERDRAVAFAYGFLLHVAGDAIGHTWVNSHSGGAWDWGDMNLVARHISLESYVNSKLPGAETGDIDFSLTADGHFLAETLIRHEDTRASVVRAGHLKALVDYRDFFRSGERKLEKLLDKTWGLDISGGALSTMEDALEHQRKVAEDAMAAWIDTGTLIMRDVATGSFVHVPGYVTDWMLQWIPRLVGVPGCVYTALEYLGWPITVVTDWLSEQFDKLLEEVYNSLLRDTFESLVNPEVFFRQTQSEAEQARILEELGVTPEHPGIDPQRFYALYDTIVLGKLTLLDDAGMAQLSEALGATIPMSGPEDNVLYDCVNSLDASNQLALHPVCRLLETDEMRANVYERLFKGAAYQAAPSSIDPAHLFVWSADRKTLTFAAPVPDPCCENARAIGYVYQESDAGGPEARVPVFEAGIPTFMLAGRSVGLVSGDYEPAEGREGRYHLATALPDPEGNEPLEDAGVDVVLDLGDFGDPMPGYEGAVNYESWAELLEQMGLGGTQPEGFDPADAVAGRAQMVAMMEEMIATLLEAGRTEQAAALQAQLDALNAGGPADDEVDGAGSELPTEPFVYPVPMTTNLIAAVEGGQWDLTDLDDLEDAPVEMAEGLARFAVGTVEDAQGQPLTDAALTFVERSVYDELRAATGVPVVNLGQWMAEGRYLCGRTNEAGHYYVPNVLGGMEYVVVATAPRLPKLERPLTIEVADSLGVVLEPIILVDRTEGEAAGDAAGEHGMPPRFMVVMEPPLLNWDLADAEGSAPATVTLRALNGFTGPVALSFENLPPGVRVEAPTEPIDLMNTVEWTVRFRAEPGVPSTGRATLVARSGDLEERYPVYLALDRGALVSTLDAPTLAPGETVTFRLRNDGLGQAPMVSLMEIPDGLTLRVRSLKSNRDVEPLIVENLTVDKAREAAESLRPLVPLLTDVPPTIAPITEEDVRTAPTRALSEGLLLAPEGWVEVDLVAAADLEPGVHRIRLQALYGEVYAESFDIPVVVSLN